MECPVRLLWILPCALLACTACSGGDETIATTTADTGTATSPDDAAADAPPRPRADVRYATKVVSYTKGDKGGFNEEKLPDIVLGPPHGGGCCAGSLDVLSLGDGGEIVLGFDVEIVDGPGIDFLVFENAFEAGGDPTAVLAEPAEVAVSEDGVTWTAFPCTATSYPYGTCAGWHTTHATPETGIDGEDLTRSGGDPFDLATIGVKRARFVRIRDANGRFPAKDPTAGFDLDGVAILRFAP